MEDGREKGTVIKRKHKPKDPAVVIYNKKFRDKELTVSVDKFCWIVAYNGVKPQYYSHFTEMVKSLYRQASVGLVRSLKLEEIIAAVTQTQAEITDFVVEVQEMFAKTPFMTPDRRDEENKIANKEGEYA